MARIDTLGNFLTDVADAIRTKKGTQATINAADFDTEIENLPSGGGADLSEYFNNEITENRTTNTSWDFMKKLPVLTVANNVTQLSYLFDGNNFKINDKNGQITAPKVVCGNNVTNMSYMYASSSNDNNMVNIDLSGLDTSNVTTMANMFNNKRAITSLNFSNFDFSNVTTINGMFNGCVGLNQLDLSNMRGESFTTAGFGINQSFYNCTNVQKIDLSNFEPVEAIDTRSAFYGCYRLEELYLDKWDLSTKVRSGYFGGMFTNCGYQLESGTYTKVYVKDQAAQTWVLTASNGHPSTWTTDNVIIAGSEADLRNA